MIFAHSCVFRRILVRSGLLDGDTVETLLQEPNLTLTTTIGKCQAQEASKKQRAYIANQQPEAVAALQRQRNPKSLVPKTTCPGCGAATHPGGRSQCPAYMQTCFQCQKIGHFAKVCRSKPARHNPHPT